MLTKFLNCLIATGLIGFSTVSSVQAKPHQFYPNTNSGVNSTLIILNQGRYNQVSPVVPQRASYYNPYYPGANSTLIIPNQGRYNQISPVIPQRASSYYNPSYLRPVYATQDMMMINNRDRNNNGNYQQNRHRSHSDQNRGYYAPYGNSKRTSSPYHQKTIRGEW